MDKRIVLVTGASSGIGLATARRFAAAGHVVYGTSRRPCQIEGIHMLTMDVCADDPVQAGIRQILTEQGRLDILVSNAGMGLAGSIEDTTVEEAKAQFETNYFGALRVIREVLPIMRAQRSGSIVGVSSMAAPLAIPFQAGYSASKAALEATLTALRGEVGPFGIRVGCVLPGDTRTGFTEARRPAEATVSAASNAYRERCDRSIRRMARDERNGVSPDKVARAIVKTAMSTNPPVRRAVGADYTLLLFIRRMLPERLVASLVNRLYAA